MFITVFTPTYNRRDLIEVLFNSLLKQTCFDFEWLVVDDGSSDDTVEYFEDLKKQNIPFQIQFIQNAHGGKHRAINKGLEFAKGELFFLVDSDDYIKESAVEKVIERYDSFEDKSNICGICGLLENSNGEIVGKKFPSNRDTMNLIEMMRTKYEYDHLDVFVTELFRKYPYPEIENEWHVAPGVPIVRMARDGYDLLLLNESYYVRDYLPHGLTFIGDKKSTENYIGYTIRSKELIEAPGIGFQKRTKTILKYLYISRLKNCSISEVSKNLNISKISLVVYFLIMKLIPKKIIGN